MTTVTNVYERSTIDFIHLPVTKDGATQTVGVTYSIVKQPGAEGAHEPADIMNGKTGRIISEWEPGLYKVWAAVTPEGTGSQLHPHFVLGTFRIV
jgi:hypothetical protein